MGQSGVQVNCNKRWDFDTSHSLESVHYINTQEYYYIAICMYVYMFTQYYILYYIGYASAEGTTSTGSIQDEADWMALQDGDQLNDKHINAANTILIKQYPDRAGFQHTLRYQSTQKPITPQTKEGTIQLHNVRSNHWVTTNHPAS